MQIRAFCIVLAVALLIPLSPLLAKDFNPADFPIQVEVLAFQRETAVRDGGTQTQTNCLGSTNGTGTARTYDGGDSYNIQTNSTTATSCQSSTEHTQYVYRGAGMRVKVGDRVYVVECMSRLPGIYAAFSKCNPLSPGQYAARWHGNQLEILTTKSNGKPITISYNVMGGTTAALGQPAAPQPKQTDQPQAPAPASVPSEVSIVSAPTGADISVDGRFVGNTPSNLDLVDGDHTISISMAGYQLWERRIHTSGGRISLNATLVGSATDETTATPVQNGAAATIPDPPTSLGDAARAARAQHAEKNADPQN